MNKLPIIILYLEELINITFNNIYQSPDEKLGGKQLGKSELIYLM